MPAENRTPKDGRWKVILKLRSIFRERELKLFYLEMRQLKKKECSVLVTNDSAPFHIATAVKTPAVSIFCATTPKFGFAVRAKTNKIMNVELPCKPCSLHGGKRCRMRHYRCAEKIGAGEVIEAIRNII